MSRIRKDTETSADGEVPEEPKAFGIYREFPERALERSKPTDPCGEPGCTKTVADHIAEFREAMRHIRERAVRL